MAIQFNSKKINSIVFNIFLPIFLVTLGIVLSIKHNFMLIESISNSEWSTFENQLVRRHYMVAKLMDNYESRYPGIDDKIKSLKKVYKSFRLLSQDNKCKDFQLLDTKTTQLINFLSTQEKMESDMFFNKTIEKYYLLTQKMKYAALRYNANVIYYNERLKKSNYRYLVSYYNFSQLPVIDNDTYLNFSKVEVF